MGDPEEVREGFLEEAWPRDLKDEVSWTGKWEMNCSQLSLVREGAASAAPRALNENQGAQPSCKGHG